MHITKLILSLLTATMIILPGCKPDTGRGQIQQVNFKKGGLEYTLDTVLLTDTFKAFKATPVSEIKFENETQDFAMYYASLFKHNTDESKYAAFDFHAARISDEVPERYLPCLSSGPKTIRDLKDGVMVDAYEFKAGDEAKLALLGFLNVNMQRSEKITVVEFSQTGSTLCNRDMLKWGVGCRLMMRIRSHGRGAKLNTPQQITASVIFGKAEVTFSMRTFGITGPGVSKLNRVGSVTEDTYKNFMEEISNLIVDVYNAESQFTIEPQPLFLKN